MSSCGSPTPSGRSPSTGSGGRTTRAGSTCDEYDDRLVLAYRAVTYADLDQLFADLPPATHRPPVAPAPPAVRPQTAVWTGFLPLPLPLKILWTIWAAAVVINVTVWLLVSLSTGEPEYFWPCGWPFPASR